MSKQSNIKKSLNFSNLEYDGDDKIQNIESFDYIPNMKKRRGKKPASENTEDDKTSFLNRMKTESKSYVLSRVPHHALPSFNLNIKGTSLSKLCENTLFECCEPEIVYVSSQQPNKVDICHKRTMAYSEYNRSIIRHQSYFNLAEKKKNVKKNYKKNIYPYMLVSFAELLENNPDPYFNGRYDWYFTGGNLFCDNDNNLVASAAGNNLEKLVISRFKKRNGKNLLRQMSTIDYSQVLTDNYKLDIKYLEILEIQRMKALKNRFLIRQKNSVSIFTYDGENLENDIIITNFAIDSSPIITTVSHLYKTDTILTGDLNKKIHLWDLKNSTTNPMNCIFEFQFDENWNQLKNFDENTFALATSKKLYLLDIRLPPIEISKNFCNFSKKLDICENITTMELSNFSNCIYFGSTHKLFSIDPRYILNNYTIDSNLFLQRWTHQMKLPPIMLKSFNFVENYDIMVASSPLSGDLRLIENYRKLVSDTGNSNLVSFSLPYTPPSLMDSFRDARKMGECLDPTTNLERRIKSSICGLDFFKRGSKLHTIFSNSLGDVFTQQLLFDTEESKPKFNECLKKYNDDIKVNLIDESQILTVTDIKDLSGIKKVLRCNRLNNRPQDDKENLFSDIGEIKQQIKRSKWQRSISELSKYKDVLAQDLLAIWEIDCESDEENNDIKMEFKKIKHEKKLDVSVKVGNWIENSIFDDNDISMIDLDFTANNIASSTQINPVEVKLEIEPDLEMPIADIVPTQNFRTIIHNVTSPNKYELSKSNFSYSNDFKEENDFTLIPIATPTKIKRNKPKKTHVGGF